MKKQIVLCAFLLALITSTAVAQTAPATNDWKPVEQAIGRSGQQQPDGAYKFSFPRGDLKVNSWVVKGFAHELGSGEAPAVHGSATEDTLRVSDL